MPGSERRRLLREEQERKRGMGRPDMGRSNAMRTATEQTLIKGMRFRCPFCRIKSSRVERLHGGWTVRCVNCDASGGRYESVDEAVKIWRSMRRHR